MKKKAFKKFNNAFFINKQFGNFFSYFKIHVLSDKQRGWLKKIVKLIFKKMAKNWKTPERVDWLQNLTIVGT